jgi:hypothetical protein
MSNVTSAGGGASERFFNCPSSGQVQTEFSRWLMECQVNAHQIAMGGDANGTGLAVWERFDGTHYDIYADCYTQASATACGGAAASGWRSSYTVPGPNDCAAIDCPTWTLPYAVLNDVTITTTGCPTGASCRMAFSPQVALDSTGNGLAIWTQVDSTGRWRIYGMRFRAGTGFDTATRGTIDNYSSGDFHYTNPVQAMEWQNAGNAANCPLGVNCGNGWALFLESEYFPGGLLPPSLNVRVRANQWLCQSGASNC